MFGAAWKQVRGATFTANRVLGLREQLGAIPLLIDDVNRDRFTREVPDLVKFDRERSSLYAPVILSTNKQVSAVSPDIRKRAVVCMIDAAIPDQQSASKEIAHRAHANIGATLYRAYLKRRFADSLRIDLNALEKIYGKQAFAHRRGWFMRLLLR
jgi:predicted metal-dependent phosphoesterase TrpH